MGSAKQPPVPSVQEQGLSRGRHPFKIKEQQKQTPPGGHCTVINNPMHVPSNCSLPHNFYKPSTALSPLYNPSACLGTILELTGTAATTEPQALERLTPKHGWVLTARPDLSSHRQDLWGKGGRPPRELTGGVAASDIWSDTQAVNTNSKGLHQSQGTKVLHWALIRQKMKGIASVFNPPLC